VYTSDANFLLIKVTNANQLYQFLADKGIIVRNRTNEIGCNNCIRITIGTPKENDVLLNYLFKYNQI
jgi:histidinol-phosphate aminotransferase